MLCSKSDGGNGGNGGGGSGKKEKYYTIDFDNLAKLTNCNSSAEIVELITSCNSSVFDTEGGGLGFTDTDGKCKLSVRVHGKSFFDGHELVRLMNRCASPVYGGDVSDEYFIYDSTYPSSCTVVSNRHAILGRNLYYATMSADLDGDFAGETLKSGLAIETNSGAKRELVAKNVTTGLTEFNATIPAGYFYGKIVHSPVSRTPALRVKYDSVMLAEDISEYEPYDGYTVEFEIGSPLLKLDDVSDAIDLLNGIIYRAIENKLIDENTEIREVVYCGFNCFALDTPGNSSTSVVIGTLSNGELEDLEINGEGIIVSGNCETIYVYLGEDVSLEEARSYLEGQRILYISEVVSEEYISQSLSTELGEGTRYIEICSPYIATSYINYKQME